jgi:K+-sensing histidine kinase KdpD
VTFSRQYRAAVMFALAVTTPLVVTAALTPFRSSFANAATALVLVVVIAAIAIAGNRASGFVASVFSALWFDFFFTRPYNSFDIHGRDSLEITICLVVVGLAVTELAAQNRRHSRQSSQESRYVAMVRDLTDLAQASSSTVLVERAEPMLIDLLALRACRFDPRPSDPPMARILESGDVLHVGMQWPVDELGIPGPEAEIVALWRGRTLGRFVLTPTPGEPVSQERRAVAALLASVVAAGLADHRQSA